MNKEQRMVKMFHDKFGLHVGKEPGFQNVSILLTRVSLIAEEFGELFHAINRDDIVNAADALADLMYVIYGAALAFGIDLEPVFAEVHRSNMSKDGGKKNQIGKLVKPDTYSPADVKGELEKQGWKDDLER